MTSKKPSILSLNSLIFSDGTVPADSKFLQIYLVFIIIYITEKSNPFIFETCNNFDAPIERIS